MASWIGEVANDDPPYLLEARLDEPAPCWCRLEVVPDAGASTVSITVSLFDGRPVPDGIDAANAVRDTSGAPTSTASVARSEHRRAAALRQAVADGVAEADGRREDGDEHVEATVVGGAQRGVQGARVRRRASAVPSRTSTRRPSRHGCGRQCRRCGGRRRPAPPGTTGRSARRACPAPGSARWPRRRGHRRAARRPPRRRCRRGAGPAAGRRCSRRSCSPRRSGTGRRRGSRRPRRRGRGARGRPWSATPGRSGWPTGRRCRHRSGRAGRASAGGRARGPRPCRARR